MTSKSQKQSIKLDGQVLDAGGIDIKIEVCKPQFHDDHMTDNFGLFDKRKATITLQHGQDLNYEKIVWFMKFFIYVVGYLLPMVRVCVWKSQRMKS